MPVVGFEKLALGNVAFTSSVAKRMDTCGKPRIMMITLTCSMISRNQPAIPTTFLARRAGISVYLRPFAGNRTCEGKARCAKNFPPPIKHDLKKPIRTHAKMSIAKLSKFTDELRGVVYRTNLPTETIMG